VVAVFGALGVAHQKPTCDHVETRCVNFTRRREGAHSYGRIIGIRSSYRKLSQAFMRPHALISPFLSRKNLPRAQDASDSSSDIL